MKISELIKKIKSKFIRKSSASTTQTVYRITTSSGTVLECKDNYILIDYFGNEILAKDILALERIKISNKYEFVKKIEALN